MWLTSSSIGRKFIMALTGAFLVLFVTFHVLMNGVALFWPAAYNVVCEFLGANWYALIGSAILAGGFLLHILYALWLTVENLRARGKSYKVSTRPHQVEWSSKNMLVLGIVVLCFLAVHMYQFWAKMQLVEVLHLPTDIPPAAGTLFIQQAFSCPWTLVIYLIGFLALWLHMNHGFWSMWQSSGLNNKTWLPRLKCIALVWSTCVVGLFAIEAIVFTVNAKKQVYLNCPVLQEQYMEMAGGECCGEPAECPFAECENAAECGDCTPCGDCNGCAACEGCAEGCENCEGCAEGCENCEGCKSACAAACADCSACGEACAEAGCNGCENHANCTDCPKHENCPKHAKCTPCPDMAPVVVETQVSETLSSKLSNE